MTYFSTTAGTATPLDDPTFSFIHDNNASKLIGHAPNVVPAFFPTTHPYQQLLQPQLQPHYSVPSATAPQQPTMMAKQDNKMDAQPSLPSTATSANKAHNKKSSSSSSSSSSTTTSNDKNIQIKPTWKPVKLDEKPPFSYATIIAHAILSSEKRKLTLSEIYQWISEQYPCYSMKDHRWQNSIRHNLSLQKAFVKLERDASTPSGKGCYWTILPGYEQQFIDNLMKRGMNASTHCSASPTSSSSSSNSSASAGNGKNGTGKAIGTATHKQIKKFMDATKLNKANSPLFTIFRMNPTTTTPSTPSSPKLSSSTTGSIKRKKCSNHKRQSSVEKRRQPSSPEPIVIDDNEDDASSCCSSNMSYDSDCDSGVDLDCEISNDKNGSKNSRRYRHRHSNHHHHHHHQTPHQRQLQQQQQLNKKKRRPVSMAYGEQPATYLLQHQLPYQPSSMQPMYIPQQQPLDQFLFNDQSFFFPSTSSTPTPNTPGHQDLLFMDQPLMTPNTIPTPSSNAATQPQDYLTSMFDFPPPQVQPNTMSTSTATTATTSNTDINTTHTQIPPSTQDSSMMITTPFPPPPHLQQQQHQDSLMNTPQLINTPTSMQDFLYTPYYMQPSSSNSSNTLQPSPLQLPITDYSQQQLYSTNHSQSSNNHHGHHFCI